MPKLLFFVFFYFLINLISAQNCLYDAQWIGNQNNNPSLLNNETAIDILDEHIIINKDTLNYEIVSSHYFIDNESLNQILNCEFPIFEDFRKMINGRVKTYEINYTLNGLDINELTYFSFETYGRKFHFIVLNYKYLYEFINAPFEINLDSRYYSIIKGSTSSIDFITLDQISGSFELIDSMKSEIQFEQVLVKGSYNSHIIIPAEFEQEWTYYINEKSTCPDAEFETVTEQYLYREESAKLEIMDAEFETVSEQILTKWAYEGAAYYERDLFTIDTINSQFDFNLLITGSDPACRDYQYLNCVDEIIVIDSSYISTQIGDVYASCRNDYFGAGIYCYTEFGERPAEYETRTYEKLVMPSKVNSETIPAEYKTLTRTIIKNKTTLDPSCIEYATDSLQFYKLIKPTSSESTIVNALYTTRQIERVLESPNFNAISNNEEPQTVEIINGDKLIQIEKPLPIPQFNQTCIHSAILDRFVELDLIPNSEIVFSVAYYQAIVDYQIRFNLPIGVISQSLLDNLNIQL